MGLFDLVYQIGQIPAYFFGSKSSPQVPQPVILPTPTPIVTQSQTIITLPTQQEQGAIISKPAPSVFESARTVIVAGTTPISANKPFVENFETQFKNVGIGVANVFNYAAAKGYASIEGSPSLKAISEQHPVFASNVKTIAEGTLGIGLAIPRGLAETTLIPGTILSHAGTGKLGESDITAATSFGIGLVLPSIFKGASMVTRPIGTAIVESGAPSIIRLAGHAVRYAPEIVGGGMLAGYGANVYSRVNAPSLGDASKVFQPSTIQEKTDYAKLHPGMELTGFDVTTQSARPPTFMEKYGRLSNILGTEVFPMSVGAGFNPMVERAGIATAKAVPQVYTIMKEGFVIKTPANFLSNSNLVLGRVEDISIVRPGRASDVRLGQIEKPAPRRSTTRLQQLERPGIAEEELVPYISRSEMESTLSKLKTQKAELELTTKPANIHSSSKFVNYQLPNYVTKIRSQSRGYSSGEDLVGHTSVVDSTAESEIVDYFAESAQDQGLKPIEIAKTMAIQKSKMQLLLNLSPLSLLKTKVVVIPKTIQSQKEVAIPVSIFKQVSKQQPVQIPISKALPKQIITPFTRPVTIAQGKVISTTVPRMRVPKQELKPESRTIEMFRPKTTTDTIPRTSAMPRIKTPSKPESSKKKLGGKRGFYGYGEFAKIATVNEMFRG